MGLLDDLANMTTSGVNTANQVMSAEAAAEQGVRTVLNTIEAIKANDPRPSVVTAADAVTANIRTTGVLTQFVLDGFAALRALSNFTVNVNVGPSEAFQALVLDPKIAEIRAAYGNGYDAENAVASFLRTLERRGDPLVSAKVDFVASTADVKLYGGWVTAHPEDDPAQAAIVQGKVTNLIANTLGDLGNDIVPNKAAMDLTLMFVSYFFNKLSHTGDTFTSEPTVSGIPVGVLTVTLGGNPLAYITKLFKILRIDDRLVTAIRNRRVSSTPTSSYVVAMQALIDAVKDKVQQHKDAGGTIDSALVAELNGMPTAFNAADSTFYGPITIDPGAVVGHRGATWWELFQAWKPMFNTLYRCLNVMYASGIWFKDAPSGNESTRPVSVNPLDEASFGVNATNDWYKYSFAPEVLDPLNSASNAVLQAVKKDDSVRTGIKSAANLPGTSIEDKIDQYIRAIATALFGVGKLVVGGTFEQGTVIIGGQHLQPAAFMVNKTILFMLTACEDLETTKTFPVEKTMRALQERRIRAGLTPIVFPDRLHDITGPIPPESPTIAICSTFNSTLSGAAHFPADLFYKYDITATLPAGTKQAELVNLILTGLTAELATSYVYNPTDQSSVEGLQSNGNDSQQSFAFTGSLPAPDSATTTNYRAVLESIKPILADMQAIVIDATPNVGGILCDFQILNAQSPPTQPHPTTSDADFMVTKFTKLADNTGPAGRWANPRLRSAGGAAVLAALPHYPSTHPTKANLLMDLPNFNTGEWPCVLNCIQPLDIDVGAQAVTMEIDANRYRFTAGVVDIYVGTIPFVAGDKRYTSMGGSPALSAGVLNVATAMTDLSTPDPTKWHLAQSGLAPAVPPLTHTIHKSRASDFSGPWGSSGAYGWVADVVGIYRPTMLHVP